MATGLISLANFSNDGNSNGTSLSNLFSSVGFRDLTPFLVNVKNDWSPAVGSHFKEEKFNNFSLKRAKALNCKFDQCDFTYAAGNGSDWSGSEFMSCNFDDTNMQYANFSNCKFTATDKTTPTGLFSSGFYGATFRGIHLSRANVKGCSFTNADFSNAIIDDLTISSCTFEGASFNGATLLNIDLSSVNVEYCDFSNAIMNEVTLPFWQFPYVFGIKPNDIRAGKVKISAPGKGIIAWEELLELIPSLVKYYQDRFNYFPCANLLLLSEHQEFSEYINDALKNNILYLNVRELKYLSKLLVNSQQYSQSEMSELYLLMQKASLNGNEYQKNNWCLHEGDIRKLLLREGK